MAEYGKTGGSEPTPAPLGKQPLCKTPAGLGIAIAGGLAGGMIAGGPMVGLLGIIASPIALWFFSDRGETVLKDKHGKDLIINGKVAKSGPWTKWVTTGIFFVPVIWVAEASFKTATKPPVPTLEAIFNGGKGDIQEVGRLWMKKYELSSRWSCEGAIKERLKDPSSMETRDVSYDSSPFLAASPPLWATKVNVVYGARNGFGGMTIGTASCWFSIDGVLSNTKFKDE
jgi:hypothetical protein